MPPDYRASRKLLNQLFSKEGRRYRRRVVRGAYAQLTTLEAPTVHPKAAFAVSAKVAPRAVDRNRVKRRARAIVAQARARLLPGTVYFFVFNSKARTASFVEMQTDIHALLSS